MERIELGELHDFAQRGRRTVARRSRIRRKGNDLDRFRRIGYRPARSAKIV